MLDPKHGIKFQKMSHLFSQNYVYKSRWLERFCVSSSQRSPLAIQCLLVKSYYFHCLTSLKTLPSHLRVTQTPARQISFHKHTLSYTMLVLLATQC